MYSLYDTRSTSFVYDTVEPGPDHHITGRPAAGWRKTLVIDCNTKKSFHTPHSAPRCLENPLTIITPHFLSSQLSPWSLQWVSLSIDLNGVDVVTGGCGRTIAAFECRPLSMAHLWHKRQNEWLILFPWTAAQLLDQLCGHWCNNFYVGSVLSPWHCYLSSTFFVRFIFRFEFGI